jgi:hypothetical protein
MCSREAGIIVVVVFHGFRFSFFFFLFSFLLCFNFYIRDTCGSYWMCFLYIYYCTNANLG